MGSRSRSFSRSLAALALGALGALVVVAGDARAEQPHKPKPPPPPPTTPAIPPEIAARLPADGFLIAHATDLAHDDWFGITRIDRNGATELVHEPWQPDRNGMAWLDAHTLVVVTTDDDSDTTTVRRYRDGRPDPAPIVIPAGAWTFPKGRAIDDTLAPELWLGKGGALWLARCHSWRAREMDEVCSGTSWLRVDGTPAPSAKKPAGVKRAGPVVTSIADGGLPPKAVKAPAGYDVKLRTIVVDDGVDRTSVKGFTCRGPGGSATWPTADITDWQYDVRPAKLAWIATTPPMFVVTGKATNPVGTVSTERRVFRACSPTAVSDVVFLGDNRRLEMKAVWQGDQYLGTAWTLYVDDVAIASIEGSPWGVQVAPLP